MSSTAPVPILTTYDLELDPGTVEFVIGRVENLSSTVRRNALAAHRHDFYQVVWLTHAVGTVWIDLDGYPVKPNTMCFISPGQIHGWEFDGPTFGYLLAFTHRFFSGCPDDATALTQLPYFYGVGSAPVIYADEESAALFTEVCCRLEREQQSALVGQTTVLRSYMRILLIEARRAHDAQPGVIHSEDTGFLLTKQFIQLLEAHYLDTSSVADYAAMLHVTTNHLIETITRRLGLPAGRIIRERLLLEAKRLLRYSDLTVAEIAHHLNFEDPSYFSRFFKKNTGVSPTEFR